MAAETARDLEASDTIVLTRDQYERLETEHRALRGLVQSLMPTSHLLFVGFGFAYSDFLAMSKAVAKVRETRRGRVPGHQGRHRHRASRIA